VSFGFLRSLNFISTLLDSALRRSCTKTDSRRVGFAFYNAHDAIVPVRD
jgi:hypothetical protein